MIDIPRKPKAVEPPVPEPVNGAAVTGKRKAEEAGLTDGDERAKRIASASVVGGDGERPIVLDEADGGAILIDD